VRARPARGYAALFVLLIAVAETACAEAPAAARGEVAQPAAESVGLGLELGISALQARVKKLESEQPAGDGTTDALREYGAAIDQLQQAADWTQRVDSLARLQSEGEALLQSTRTEIEAWSKPVPAPVSPHASQSEVEVQLAEADARLAAQRKAHADVDAELARLAERRLTLPAELAAAGAGQEGLLGELALAPLPAGTAEAALARRASSLARQKAARAQTTALELEIATQEIRRELIAARRDLFRRKADVYAARVGELQAELAARRVREAEQAAAEARADQAALASVHPVLGALAEENARLAAERTGAEGLSARIDATARELSAVADRLQRLDERARGVRQKVAAAGLSDAIGLLLRKERADLPEAERSLANIRARREQISAAQFHALSLEDELRALPALEIEVEGILAAQADAGDAAQRKRIEESARNVLQTRRSYLDVLIRDYNSWFSSLVDLDAKETQFVRLVEDYRDFLDQNVLWIPNASLPKLGKANDARMAAQWLVDPRNYMAAAARLAATARTSPVATGLGLGLIVAIVLYRPRLKKLHARLCEQKRVEGLPNVPAPLAASLLVAVVALPGPLALWLAGWMIAVAPLPLDDFSRALGSVLTLVARPLLIAEFLRRAVGNQGIAASFLELPRSALATIRAQVVLFETVALPGFALSLLFDAQADADWSETLGRLGFCVGVAAAGVGLWRLLSPRAGVAWQVLRRTDLEKLAPLVARLSWVPIAGAVLMILVALGGYYFTATVLVERLWSSSLVLLAFLVANAATLRWLATRDEALAEVAAREEAETAEAVGETDGREAADLISQISAQTRSLMRVVFGLGLVVALFYVWVDVFPALRYFESVEVWKATEMVEKTVGTGDAARVETTATQVPVTVANVLIALLGAMLAVVGARSLPALLELVLLSRLRLDRGLRYAIATVTRYAVFLIGSVVALENLGVAWSSVQWMVAAVSVGLGFGLQEIFGNFVSGLIVLFERPVRVGDTVTIEGVTGTVARIEMRATTLIDSDRKELIVPNKSLITGKIVNWSLHDPMVRLVIPVSVAHGSDPGAVGRILLEAAKQCATVLESPAPVLAFTKLGEAALEFELRVFVMEPEQIGPTRHELLVAIERRLRAAGIEAPVAQQDVTIKSISAEAARMFTTRAPEPEAAGS
jgi:potassium efflux system protein